MNQNPILSIIIVNYNNGELLKGCLESIRTTQGSLEIEIFVVDNNSSDNSLEMIRKTFPHIKIIANPTNVGYAKAVNQAIKTSLGKYIFVLNADIIIKSRAIQSLLSFMDNHPDCAIAGPKLFYPNGQLQLSCRTFYTLKTILFRRTILGRIFPESKILQDHLMSGWDHNCQKEVDWMLGAALMVRRETINQIGLMDERYFLYLEDVDWCYRMNNAGWKVFYVPQAEIIHYYRQGSRSESVFNRDVFVHLCSMLRYYDKWNKALYALKKLFNILKGPAALLLDFMGILLSFWISSYLIQVIKPISRKPPYPITFYYGPLFIFSTMTVFVYYLSGLYENKRSWLWVDRLFLIARCTFISSLILIVSLFLFSKNYHIKSTYSKVTLISTFLFTIFIATSLHQIVYFISSYLWSQRFNLKRLLIVGNDQTALNIKEELSKAPELGYELVGFISPKKNPTTLPDFRMTGNINNLLEICNRERVREVFYVNIADDFENIIYSFIKCRRKLIDVKIISEDFGSETIDSRIKDFLGVPSIDFECKPFYYIGLGLKQFMDILIAFIGLIILSPIIIFILLRLSFEKGPIFFIQKRIGKDGKKFFIYKFKSMIPDAEKQKNLLDNIAKDGPLFKVRNDPRVTRFGQFLRKHNLDEIPQLVNVLKGEMSLIGPRPPLPEEVALYKDWHKSRLEIKPGITGLWQVDKKRKWRFNEMVKLDIYYILNWSLFLDIKILFRTPGAILKGSGTQL